VIHHSTYGHWNCLLCGEEVNMGFLELVNPIINSLPMEISYYAHHFLSKGSFAYEGRIEGGKWKQGRLDPVQLADYLNFVSNIKPDPNNFPDGFVLEQNYPNPFNPSTTINFNLPKTSKVTLKVFNILGKEVATLVSDKLSAGSHSYQWSQTEGMASGIYLYRLEANGFVRIRKMILMK
jgi:hypothetical protein